MLEHGIYEQIVNEEINDELKKLQDDDFYSQKIDNAESSEIITQYLSEFIKKSLDLLNNNCEEQIKLANSLIDFINNNLNKDGFINKKISKPDLLLAIVNDKQNIIKKRANEFFERPVTSIAHSSLFTGAIYEPQMLSELRKEINSSNRIDILVSFIKWTGLRLIINDLKEFTKHGKLRVITTTYMGATSVKAVEELSKLDNTEIKISYDTQNTRLHAKAYVFYRNTGFNTAYVGSSNLSNAAISSGLEWNLKISSKDQPNTLNKIYATFDSYWNSKDFCLYTTEDKIRFIKAISNERIYDTSNNEKVYVFDIQPYSYQQEILDKIQAERLIHNNYKNLIVAATGTGKTVIAAFDYKNYSKSIGKDVNLLFVAHREEILKQSLETFRGILKNPNFGELLVGNSNPTTFNNLFVSIQSLNSKKLIEQIEDNFYEYIIVDEFHHAAAPTYKNLLEYFKPKILLGLTATPERMDGKDITCYFNNHITAEIRLPEAIERKLLCPFHYFGITDTVNLSDVKWVNGGYDKNELNNLYAIDIKTSNIRAEHIITNIKKYVNSINEVKGIGFCVSKKHAEFMAEYFNACNIKSKFLCADSSNEDRMNVKRILHSGEIKFIFVVDLYNEGVDIPEINTILFLRPTESLTIFLQQLGRGLRLSEDKDCLTVLDFIGQANNNYKFEEKFLSLLNNTKHGLEKEIKDGFISTPKGCYIQLEKVASEYILENIKKSFRTKNSIIYKIQKFNESSGMELNLENFIQYYNLDIRFVYNFGLFQRLCNLAGLTENFELENEELIRKGILRLSEINSRRWINFLVNFISNFNINKVLTSIEQTMLNMFYATIWTINRIEDWDLKEQRINNLLSNAVIRKELIEVLSYKYKHIDFIDKKNDLDFECPLDLYCSYSKAQILIAMGHMLPSSCREGVKWFVDKKTDIFFITLNKSDKDYSPSTMYDDYSINSELFHWQSQSITSEFSETGQRYINHKKLGSKILLFIREFNKDKYGASNYIFMGEAEYVSHSGSKPMNIIWKLNNEIPARFIKQTNKLIF